MRITQSMLSNNMLRNLSSSYSKMGVLQEQLNTGKKISRPSQDPVVAIKGIGYRTNLSKIEQYERNLGEANNWLDTTDDALDKVGSALHRVRELIIDAANDTKTSDDRTKIAKEIEQIKLQLLDLGNTKVGDKYVFSGTKTLTPLYDANGTLPDYNADGFLIATGSMEEVKIEINDGVELKVNSNGINAFSDIDDTMEQLHMLLTTGGSGDTISSLLGTVDTNMNLVLAERSEIGARQNRVEMMANRLSSQNIIVKKQLSNNEDVDYEKAITDLITQEAIHNAGLSVGSRIIQQTLVDFLR